MAFTVRDYQDMVRLLDQHPEWQAELRRLLLADDFLALPAIVRDLAEAQRGTEQRLEQLSAEVRALAVDVRNLTTEVRSLTDWQRGEAGRREGERYEIRILKRAPALFNGGEGGATHQPFVQRRLTEKLKPLLATETFTENEDPFLADLIWRRPEPVEGWKGEQFVVVEASRVVNGNDVARAARRAGTLQRANVQAMGIVIGDEWTGPEIRQRAQASAIQWKVGDDFSEGWLDFRRRPA
jgi:hypothetical protein